MADREQDPNAEETQREQERALHRAQLEAVRSAFQPEGQTAPPGGAPSGGVDPDDAARTEYLLARLRGELRRLDRRQRNTAWFAGALAVSVGVGALAFVEWGLPRMQSPGTLDELEVRSIRADRVAVTGDLRLLDAEGNELAVLGREFAAADARNPRGPVVLTLNAEGDPSRQLLRFAASNAGAGLTLEAPTGSSSLSLLSTQAGSSVEVRNGDETQRLIGSAASELPPVGAAAKSAAATLRAETEVPAWRPAREGAPRDDIPELREAGHGFLVADLSAQPMAGGVELRGRMVNTTAVVHNGLAFKISLGGASATLTVPKVSPGNSTGFRVALPGAAADRLADAKVEYLGSTVAFQATSTEPIYGRRVERK
jgi:hypothetical protein